jgi:cell division septation protein DedD
MAIERVGSKTDMVIKLVLVFFISLLSFSIGTFVGKKFSDNQHRLAQLEPASAHGAESEKRSVASTGEDGTTGNLSDEEIAKLAEEFVSDDTKIEGVTDGHNTHGDTAATGHSTDTHGEAQNEPKADTHAATTAAGHGTATHDKAESDSHGTNTTVAKKQNDSHNTQETNHSTDAHRDVASAKETSHTPNSAATRVAEGKAPTAAEKHAAPKDTAKHATVLPKDVVASTVGKFTVQIASYSNENEAQTMADELKNKGFAAFFVPANVKGQTWYRVSVGLFATQKEAQDHKSELMEKAKVSTAIIQKITQ